MIALRWPKAAHLQWPRFLAQMDPAQRGLTVALGASLFVHAIVLSIHFKLPEALLRAKDQALDVVLVNSKGARRPDQAQVKAQANLDGGGDAKDGRIATPLPASRNARQGNDLIETRRKVVELQSSRQQMLTRLNASKPITAELRPQETQPAPAAIDGSALADRAREIARLEGEIARVSEFSNRHPMRKPLSLRAVAAPDAMYANAVLEKIERIGTLNYPIDARGKSGDKLLATLVIRPDGSLARFELDRPAERKVFNAAAERIARLAAPFPKVPAEVLDGWEVVTITRWWSFTSEDVRTSAN